MRCGPGVDSGHGGGIMCLGLLRNSSVYPQKSRRWPRIGRCRHDIHGMWLKQPHFCSSCIFLCNLKTSTGRDGVGAHPLNCFSCNTPVHWLWGSTSEDQKSENPGFFFPLVFNYSDIIPSLYRRKRIVNSKKDTKICSKVWPKDCFP